MVVENHRLRLTILTEHSAKVSEFNSKRPDSVASRSTLSGSASRDSGWSMGAGATHNQWPRESGQLKVLLCMARSSPAVSCTRTWGGQFDTGQTPGDLRCCKRTDRNRRLGRKQCRRTK